MTKEERAKICEILGFSKAIQIMKPGDKQTQKMYEEMDKRLAELLASQEEPLKEKKVIEEHHYYYHYDHYDHYDHYNHWTYPSITWSSTTDLDKTTISGTSNSITVSSNDSPCTLTL